MEKTISLYEITNDLIDLMDAEINEDVKNEIVEVIKLQMETKADNIIAVIRNYESRIEAIKSEEKRLAEYRKRGAFGLLFFMLWLFRDKQPPAMPGV